MRQRFVVALLVAFASAPSLLAGDPDGKNAPAELQGAGPLASVQAVGGSGNLPHPGPVLVIEGDRVLYGKEMIARVSADAATSPKVIDLRFNQPERVYEGVYTVEADSMKVCLNGQTD